MNAPARYDVIGLLGEGGHAHVFRALDRTLNREVAMKVLLPEYRHDAELLDRFAAEAEALSYLQHENIVQVFDVGRDGQWPYFTMELIEGPTFAEMVAEGQGLPPAVVVTMLRPLAAAIDYLHGQRLVHRDIKAANVMLGARGRVVLMDFGIARLLGRSGRTLHGAALGTPDAMAPEQIQGREPAPPADIYALGILTYQLLSGVLPFVGDTAYVLHAHVYEAPPPLWYAQPGLPPGIYAAVEAALAKDPAKRPPTAGAFIDALAVALGPGGDRADPYIRPAPEQHVTPARQARRPLNEVPRWVVGLLALFVLAILLSLIVGLVSISQR